MTTRKFGMSVAVAYSLGMNDSEFVFCRWFQTFIKTGKMHKASFNQRTFYQLYRSKVISDLPLLRIKDASHIRRFLLELVRKDILKYHFVDGDATYYRFTPKGETLFLSAWKGKQDRLLALEQKAMLKWEREVRKIQESTAEKKFRATFGEKFGIPKR